MSVSKKVRAAVLERDGHVCANCGKSLRYTLEEWYRDGELGYVVHGCPPTMDHIVPRCRGGSNKADNLTPACMSCNSQKRNKTGDEYRQWLNDRACRPCNRSKKYRTVEERRSA